MTNVSLCYRPLPFLPGEEYCATLDFLPYEADYSWLMKYGPGKKFASGIAKNLYALQSYPLAETREVLRNGRVVLHPADPFLYTTVDAERNNTGKNRGCKESRPFICSRTRGKLYLRGFLYKKTCSIPDFMYHPAHGVCERGGGGINMVVRTRTAGGQT